MFMIDILVNKFNSWNEIKILEDKDFPDIYYIKAMKALP